MNILFITPPFVQWNTAYAAIPQLMAYIKQQGYTCSHYDLSIDLVNTIFSPKGLKKIIPTYNNKDLTRIQTVIDFLQTNDVSLAHLICSDPFSSTIKPFSMQDLEWAFGTMGIIDKAKYLSTLYLKNTATLIQEKNPFFEYKSYAESLAIAAESFIPLQQQLRKNNSIDSLMLELLNQKIQEKRPDVIGFTVPFPGNLYCTLKCCEHIKKEFPKIKNVLGGGYINTEWRELTETAIFKFADFVCLDDGETPLLRILKYLEKKCIEKDLVRTYILKNHKVAFLQGDNISTSFKDLPAADYSDLKWGQYISTLDQANPMHRLWSDGRWNKMTLAHGCYWHKCSFCDTHLDYIKRYEAPTAASIADKIEKIIFQTGNYGFHFTDEAAPPKLLSDLADELLKRSIRISWWTNIRFEKSFSKALAQKMAESGCIAVSGGLEVASERILKLINKGITIPQAASVCKNFTDAGIMVHSYLMYGFPTQTAQETIDSLEIVRQFFNNGLIQSGFWHLFTLTKHSIISGDPEKYGIKIKKPSIQPFASNDLQHIDIKGCDHRKFGKGLKTALHNYMNGLGFDIPVYKWFEFRTPKTSIHPDYINEIL